jgi:2-amino-4-hydroxy-6-hydroxymethyldihydropteridine diphosphokinase
VTETATAILSLGSNLGDRESTLRLAVAEISQVPGVRVMAASGIVETPALKPHGVDRDAPAYLNAVVSVSTTLEPHELLDAVAGIELAHGRIRDVRWGDRTLDIDIIAFGGLEIDNNLLTIPHPRAAQRVFVLAPWLDIDPEAVIVGHGRVAELLAATGETVEVFAAAPLVANGTGIDNRRGNGNGNGNKSGGEQ